MPDLEYADKPYSDSGDNNNKEKEWLRKTRAEHLEALMGESDYSTFGFVNRMDEHGRSKRGLAL